MYIYAPLVTQPTVFAFSHNRILGLFKYVEGKKDLFQMQGLQTPRRLKLGVLMFDCGHVILSRNNEAALPISGFGIMAYFKS